MRTEVINNSFHLQIPDEFVPMTEEQLKRHYSTTENLVGFYRKEDNAMINVGFVPKKLLLSMMFSAKDIIRNYDSGFSKRLKDYVKTDEFSREICGISCPGMNFEYNTKHENVPMKAEVYSIKHKGAFYAVIFIVRKTGSEDPEKLSAEVLSHISLEE